MVLVFCILYNHTSILQTKFSHRERHEARRIGLETIPLDQDIEGGHGEREPRLKIGPYAVHDSLEGYFCPSRRKGKMSLAGARDSRSAGYADSCRR